MKFLGNISHLSISGRLIAKSSQSPPSGAFVFNKNKKKIGKIVGVFGPTKEPYISIEFFKFIDNESFENSSGEDLFISNNPKNRKKTALKETIKKRNNKE
jgi:RNA-binding protein